MTTTRIHLIGVCGTAMATLAAMLQAQGHDVRGSDQHVYPPMSDFLAAEGIPTSQRLPRRAHHRRSRSRGRRQRDLARQRRARRGARSQDPLLLAARGDSRALPVGRALDRHRRHARQDDDDVADRVAADARRRRSDACWSAASPATSATHGSSYRIGQGRDFVIEGDEYDSAFFDKTAKFLKYLPDIAVINNIEFDHADIYADLDAVTLAFRRLVNLVPRRGLLLIGADSPGARALIDKAVSRVQTFGTADDVDWQAHDLEPLGASTRFKVRRGGAPFGVFEVPLVGAHNVRNATAASCIPLPPSGAAASCRSPTKTTCIRTATSCSGGSTRCCWTTCWPSADAAHGGVHGAARERRRRPLRRHSRARRTRRSATRATTCCARRCATGRSSASSADGMCGTTSSRRCTAVCWRARWSPPYRPRRLSSVASTCRGMPRGAIYRRSSGRRASRSSSRAWRWRSRSSSASLIASGRVYGARPSARC